MHTANIVAVSLVAFALSFTVGCASPSEKEEKGTTSASVVRGSGNCSIVSVNGKVTKTGDGCDGAKGTKEDTARPESSGSRNCSIVIVNGKKSVTGDCEGTDAVSSDVDDTDDTDDSDDSDIDIVQEGSGNCSIIVVNGVRKEFGDCKR